MKTYPSIPGSMGSKFREFEAYVFDKLDGSNLRFEWSRKNGFYKFGTRNHLFDETDWQFGPAKQLFMDTWSEDLSRIAVSQRWKSMTVFGEFWGPNSFAGVHEPDDEKQINVFDVMVDKKGFLSPQDFLKVFGELNIATFLGQFRWTRSFVEQVREGAVHGVTLEGVVGKSGASPRRITAKAKTQVWIDRVRSRYTAREAERLLQS